MRAFQRAGEDDMAKSRTRQPRRALTVLSVLMTTLLSAACGVVNPEYVLPDICREFGDTPLTPLSAPAPNDPTNPKVIFETQGQIKAMHGFGSAQLDSGKRIIKVEQSVVIPAYANQATVFLNGWHLNYLGGDQHVLALGALITKIKLDRRSSTLTWTAAGVLRDDDFKEAYNFTYHFTVIAWNDAALSVTVDQGNPDNFCNADTDLPDKSFVAINKDTTTALSSFSIFSQEPGLPRGKPVAVLPRGFAYFWWGGDHHMLQLGYNLDHSEIFAEQGKLYNNNPDHVRTAGDLMSGKLAPLPTPASLVDSGFVSWNTYSIFKDNDSRRDYVFSELISTVGGNDVGIVQPPFAILPKEGVGGDFLPGGVIQEHVVIENVPFEYAVPVLTGWELSYLTDDQHVKEVGISIDDWSFIGDTLSYRLSSILRDDDFTPPHSARHKVTILGIRPTVSGGVGVPRQSR
jgi:hypothetical protein